MTSRHLYLGIITTYVLYRDGIEIFRDASTRQFQDNNAILPYQTYHYKLQVCNSAGCVLSDEVRCSADAPVTEINIL